MTLYTTFCFLATIAILMAFINSKLFKTQNTIAITAGSLMVSLVIVLTGHLDFFNLKHFATTTLDDLHFNDFLLNGVLGFLLFAGGLGVKLPNLKDQKWEIITLSLLATLISTLLVGILTWLFFKLLSFHLDFIYCLLFGALISPTDPIAVLAIIKKLKAPKRISSQIEGESLFNDGIGLVIFITLFNIAFTDAPLTALSVISLFLHEAVGGILFGLVLGGICHYLICNTKDQSMEILLTLMIPTAGYCLAQVLGVSGPLSMVVAGIMIGNWTRLVGLSEQNQQNLDHFWTLIDEFLNSILFLLIGLSMLTFVFHREDFIMILLAIPIVLIARFLSVKACYLLFKPYRTYNPYSIAILTWGGLRGGLALAMAMAIPAGHMIYPEKNIDVREIILVMSYGVVLFSILVQGSSITPLLKKATDTNEKNKHKKPEA